MTTIQWNNYFEINKSNTVKVDFDTYKLTSEEIDTITNSIQSFQLGESSEGIILVEQAKRYCQQIGDFSYLDAMKHLIREENRHSSYLGQFMKIHNIPKIKKGVNDTIFRLLRKVLGIEMSARVLVTAETIALTYYDCLSVATQSELLKNICITMCKEEEEHVKFQMHHIYWMSYRKHALVSSLATICHFLLLYATTLPVWLEHKKVLKKKYNFSSFFKKVKTDFINFTITGQTEASNRLVKEGFLKAEALCT